MITITYRGIETDKNGYLEEYELNNKLASSLSQFYSDAIHLNQQIITLFDDMAVPRGDGKATFYLGTLERMHKDYQSILILLSRGLQSQARSIMRNLLEKILIMKAVDNDPENLKSWVKTQNRERNRTKKNIKLGKVHFTEEQIKDLNLEESTDVENVGYREWAERAGMECDYYTIYNIFCTDTHHTDSGMERDAFAEEGKFAGFVVGPIYENLDIYITTAMHYMLMAVDIVAKYLGLKVEWITNIQSKLDKVEEALGSIDETTRELASEKGNRG